MRPSPIWPMRRRLLAPKARAGTNIGAAAAVMAAVLITSRRVIFMAEGSMEDWKEPRVYSRRGADARRRRAALFPLLVAQRVDGIEPRRLARWIEAEDDPHAGAHCQRCHHDSGARLHR